MHMHFALLPQLSAAQFTLLLCVSRLMDYCMLTIKLGKLGIQKINCKKAAYGFLFSNCSVSKSSIRIFFENWYPTSGKPIAKFYKIRLIGFERK